MDLLQQFYINKSLNEAVKSFLDETLKEMALEKLFKGEDAKDIAAAKQVVETVFIKLKELYEPYKKVNIDNQAR